MHPSLYKCFVVEYPNESEPVTCQECETLEICCCSLCSCCTVCTDLCKCPKAQKTADLKMKEILGLGDENYERAVAFYGHPNEDPAPSLSDTNREM